MANIKVREAARYVGLSKSFLDKARIYGGGPAFRRLGSAIVYSTDDLERWMQACTVGSSNTGAEAA